MDQPFNIRNAGVGRDVPLPDPQVSRLADDNGRRCVEAEPAVGLRIPKKSQVDKRYPLQCNLDTFETGMSTQG